MAVLIVWIFGVLCGLAIMALFWSIATFFNYNFSVLSATLACAIVWGVAVGIACYEGREE